MVGMSLGGELVESFLHSDTKSHVKSIAYVDGNVALMFTIRCILQAY